MFVFLAMQIFQIRNVIYHELSDLLTVTSTVELLSYASATSEQYV